MGVKEKAATAAKEKAKQHPLITAGAVGGLLLVLYAYGSQHPDALKQPAVSHNHVGPEHHPTTPTFHFEAPPPADESPCSIFGDMTFAEWSKCQEAHEPTYGHVAPKAFIINLGHLANNTAMPSEFSHTKLD
jgi:hypothetical protein